MLQHLLLSGGKKKRLFYEWMLSRPDLCFIDDCEEIGEERLFCETGIEADDSFSKGITSVNCEWDKARPDRARPSLRRGLITPEGEAIATVEVF
ncbi:hypothetical protein K8R61_01970 [bacterium]|nr:hypothetical protein [bacterium]